MELKVDLKKKVGTKHKLCQKKKSQEVGEGS